MRHYTLERQLNGNALLKAYRNVAKYDLALIAGCEEVFRAQAACFLSYLTLYSISHMNVAQLRNKKHGKTSCNVVDMSWLREGIIETREYSASRRFFCRYREKCSEVWAIQR